MTSGSDHDRLPLTRSAVVAVVSRPSLWPTAVRAAIELSPRGWWRHRPFLPLPDPEWVHFRLVTAYGGDGSRPMGAEELITWLEWKRDFPTPSHGGKPRLGRSRLGRSRLGRSRLGKR